MPQTYINQLKDHIGESVTLKGWLYNKRSSGKLVFLQMRDGTGIVQCVVFKPNDEALYDEANSLGTGKLDHRHGHGKGRHAFVASASNSTLPASRSCRTSTIIRSRRRNTAPSS